MRKKGEISFWNETKAFGFIKVSGGGKPVFAHISSFNSKRDTPKKRQQVTFQLAKDKDGRLCAAKIVFADETLSADEALTAHQSHSGGGVPLLIVSIYFVLLMISTAFWGLPSMVLWWQLCASAAAFLAYALDKSAAQQNRWRTAENTLHMLDVVGGWPGGLMAQHIMRHKSKKESFQRVFKFTVLVSVGVVVWLHTQEGLTFLEYIIDNVLAEF